MVTSVLILKKATVVVKNLIRVYICVGRKFSIVVLTCRKHVFFTLLGNNFTDWFTTHVQRVVQGDYPIIQERIYK